MAKKENHSSTTETDLAGKPEPREVPVRLYIVRHAHAVDADKDAERPLSKRGRRQLERLADFLEDSGAFAPHEVWHSPLVRARETAKKLVERLSLEASLVEEQALEPSCDPQILGERLQALQKSIALVGHEPHLSALASWLITGRTAPPLFVLKKSAVLALERVEARWAVCWQVSPEVLG